MTSQPLRREAGRVLLLDAEGRVFLFQGVDVTLEPAPVWWFTPGGGLDPGESHPDAARREVREELGFDVGELGEPVHERRASFTFEGMLIEQHELYFVARAPQAFVPDVSGWSEVERRSILGSRWWTVDELRETPQTIYPEELADVLAALPSV